jgi:hypothetical protein
MHSSSVLTILSFEALKTWFFNSIFDGILGFDFKCFGLKFLLLAHLSNFNLFFYFIIRFIILIFFNFITRVCWYFFYFFYFIDFIFIVWIFENWRLVFYSLSFYDMKRLIFFFFSLMWVSESACAQLD